MHNAHQTFAHLGDLKAGQFAHLGPCEAIDGVGADFESQLSAIQHLLLEGVSFLLQLSFGPVERQTDVTSV